MMPAMYFMSFMMLAVALSLWLPHFFLKRAVARPFPPEYREILRRNVPAYSRMPPELQQQLRRLILQFLYQKKFIGCAGMQITDEVRVTIAGKACTLLLNRPPRIFPALQQILVYPSGFMAPRTEIGLGGVVTHANQSLSGESWSDGRVILSWDHVQLSDTGVETGQNVVLHEFAHQLDSESGSTNGAPLLWSTSHYRNWAAVLSQEFANLQLAVAYQAESVMDYYGATNPAEFFAVATETFFEKSARMAEAHPALYDELKHYYRVDPREWLQ